MCSVFQRYLKSAILCDDGKVLTDLTDSGSTGNIEVEREGEELPERETGCALIQGEQVAQ